MIVIIKLLNIIRAIFGNIYVCGLPDELLLKSVVNRVDFKKLFWQNLNI